MFNTANAARYAYNWAVEQENNAHAAEEPFIRENELRKRFTQFKRTDAFDKRYAKVSNDAMKQAIRDAHDAFIRFFKRKAKHPKFKSYRTAKLSFYQDAYKIKFTETHVYIERIANSTRRNRTRLNWIRLIEHGRIPTDAKYYNPRITYDGLNWWVSVGIEVPDKSTNQNPKTPGVGIDLGVSELAIVSDGNRYANQCKNTKIQKLERQKRHAQRVVSCKYKTNNKSGNFKKGVRCKRTKNIIKAHRRYLKRSRRITNILREHVKAFVGQVIAKNPEFVCMENLNVRGMMKNHKLAKAIAGQRWGIARTLMRSKCSEHNIAFILADRWFASSKTCNKCHNVKRDLKLWNRIYKCPVCNYTEDRDANAAFNLRDYAIAALT